MPSKPMDQWKPNFKQSLHYSTVSLLVLYNLVTVWLQYELKCMDAVTQAKPMGAIQIV